MPRQQVRHKGRGAERGWGGGMDLPLWALRGWVVSQPHGPQEARGQVEEAFPGSPKGADSPAPLGWLSPHCFPGCGGSWERLVGDGQAGRQLVTCCCVLSCRCAGHRAAGVQGWRQEDRVSALLPLG